MRLTLASAVLALSMLAAAVPPAAANVPVAKVTDAASATEIRWGPDGTMYYSELASGNVRAVTPGAKGPGDVVAHVASEGGGNGGLLGLALDPDFEDTPAFYLYYSVTVGGTKVNRVSRVLDGTETVLLDKIPWAEMHDGGKILFMADKTLLVTVGDNERRTPAQDMSSPLGKIHRIHRDGSVPADNPTAGSTIYATGVRNPFGLAMDAATGRVWFSDNGPTKWDEVNLLAKGANYGWPECLGPCGAGTYEQPVAAWETPFGPTGLSFASGSLWLGDFVFGRVHRIDPATGDNSIGHELKNEHVLAVATGPDGDVYASTYGAIWRMDVGDGAGTSPTPTTPTPPTNPNPSTPTPPDPSPTTPTPPTPDDGDVTPPTRGDDEPAQESRRAIPSPGLAPLALALALALALVRGSCQNGDAASRGRRDR